jgi:predicted GNAT family N-acyltransferase
LDEEFEIRLLEADDIVTGLSLGDADFQPLKSYLKSEAKLHQAQSLARTYALFNVSAARPRKVLGYMTLICGEIAASDVPDAQSIADGAIYRYPQFPAIKLARLAIDTSIKGNDWGTKFIYLATGIAKTEISPRVGCRFLVVDAKTKSVDFYKKTGFTLIDTPGNRARDEPVMFIDLHKLPADE